MYKQYDDAHGDHYAARVKNSNQHGLEAGRETSRILRGI